MPWKVWNEYSDTNEFLGGPGSKQLGDWETRYGWPALGVSRTRIQLALKQVAEEKGIRYETGWRLNQIEETQDGIVAYSEDDRHITADFVLGCDGLKSSVREQILAKKGVSIKDPDFTGIAVVGITCNFRDRALTKSQLGGVSPTTDFQKSQPGVHNWYGPTTCVVSHPLEDGMSIWGLNYVPKTAVPESWQSISKDQVASRVEETRKQFETWPETLQKCIRDSVKLQTIGLYDRPELPADQWYHGRMMLLGDAAHPGTYVSPHQYSRILLTVPVHISDKGLIKDCEFHEIVQTRLTSVAWTAGHFTKRFQTSLVHPYHNRNCGRSSNTSLRHANLSPQCW